LNGILLVAVFSKRRGKRREAAPVDRGGARRVALMAMKSTNTQPASPTADRGSLSGELDDGHRTKSAKSRVDLPRIERAVREILAAVGEDPEREGLRETPARVARMYQELFSGLHTDPRIHLQKFFTEKYDEMVLVRDIAFNSMCEHHMMPFIGKAHIGYVPSGKVVGLSKLARVVEEVSHRPQVQERMTEQIANLLVEELEVRGVAVVIEASHSCMAIRGVRKPDSVCVTSAMKGIFRSNLSSRSEVMTLIYGDRR
jgi:GTP cyclohydrolase I